MARTVSGANCADLDVAEGLYNLRFVGRVEGPRIRERGRSRHGAVLVIANALLDLARMDEGIGDVGDKFRATDRETERGSDIIAAHHVDLRARWEEQPAMHQQVDKALAVV